MQKRASISTTYSYEAKREDGEKEEGNEHKKDSLVQPKKDDVFSVPASSSSSFPYSSPKGINRNVIESVYKPYKEPFNAYLSRIQISLSKRYVQINVIIAYLQLFHFFFFYHRELIFKVNNIYNSWCCCGWVERFLEMFGIWSSLCVCQLVAGITKAKVN